MWLLLTITFFILVFMLANRKKFQQDQTNQDQDSSQDTTQDSSQNTPQNSSQNKAMQIHSVVTDVVHDNDTLPSSETPQIEVEEQNESDKTEPHTSASMMQDEIKVSGFLTHFSQLEKQFEKVHEWHLFNTDAAFFWHKDNPIITILCLSGFNKGEANSQQYKDYHFNLETWSWHGASPKGAATEVKKQLSEFFKEGKNLPPL